VPAIFRRKLDLYHCSVQVAISSAQTVNGSLLLGTDAMQPIMSETGAESSGAESSMQSVTALARDCAPTLVVPRIAGGAIGRQGGMRSWNRTERVRRALRER